MFKYYHPIFYSKLLQLRIYYLHQRDVIYSSIPLRYLPTYLDSNPTYSFHTSGAIPIRLQHPPIFPFNLPLETVTLLAKEDDFNPEGNTITAFPPFFTSREPDPARTLCCQGKKQTERNLPSVDPVFTPFPPFRPNREAAGVGFFSSLKSMICISRGTARNFLRSLFHRIY